VVPSSRLFCPFQCW